MPHPKHAATMPPTPAPIDPDTPLTMDESDAYAAIVAASVEHATDKDKRKLAKAGLLADTPLLKADGERTDARTDDRRTNNAEAAPDSIPTDKVESRVAVGYLARGREKAIRYLIARADGSTADAAMAAAGVASWLDLQRYRWQDPQYAVAQDYVERLRLEQIAARATDALKGLVDGDAASEKRNVRAVTFALERLRRDEFADPRLSVNQQGGRGGGVTYNITFNNGTMPPNLCGGRVANPLDAPVIDIKSE